MKWVIVFTDYCGSVFGWENSTNLDFIKEISCCDAKDEQRFVEIKYTDLTKTILQFKTGTLNGKTYLFDKFKRLKALGLYRNGLPHGPYWIKHEKQYCFANFKQGNLGIVLQWNLVTFISIILYLELKDVIWIDLTLNFTISGRLSSQGSNILENVREFYINEIGKYQSMYVLQKKNIDSSASTNSKHMLPFIINGLPSQKRIMITPSRILYFQRIAKTGTRTFIEILRNLGTNLGYSVDVPNYKLEMMGADENEIIKEIQNILVCHRDSVVRSRHFNFIDFENYGIGWNPHWFSVVRDPVERVYCSKCRNMWLAAWNLHIYLQLNSFFYYQRSSYLKNLLIERNAHHSILSTTLETRLDFETCVLNELPECVFATGSSTHDYGGHWSLISQFCGHDEVDTYLSVLNQLVPSFESETLFGMV